MNQPYMEKSSSTNKVRAAIVSNAIANMSLPASVSTEQILLIKKILLIFSDLHDKEFLEKTGILISRFNSLGDFSGFEKKLANIANEALAMLLELKK